MLRIALLGDLHYPALETDNKELLEARERFYEGFFHTFFSEKADVHVCIGDVTHNGLEEEFAGLRQHSTRYSADFRFVLGNHDVLQLPKLELMPVADQPRYDVMETEQAVLVFLDTTMELELHGWGLDEVQWEWLARQMERSPEKTMMIFAHHPVPGTTSSSPSSDKEFTAYQDLRPLLSRRVGGFYFNGHTHTHSIVQEGGWSYIQTAAAYCQPCYRVIELDEKEARIHTVMLKEEAITESAKVLYDQLKKYHRPKGPLGEDTDLELKVTISQGK